MDPGCAGIELVAISNVRTIETPQLLSALTAIMPPVAVAVVEMVLVVLLPDHPFGKIQVEVVAPGTVALL